MSRKDGRNRGPQPEPAAAWDFGSAFGASLHAWNRRRDVHEALGKLAPDDTAVTDQPRTISSRTRGVWHEL